MPSQEMIDEVYKQQGKRAEARRKEAKMTATAERPKAAEKYVYDALRGYGVKYADLTDEQRERALEAPEKHSGLRGKALAAFVVEGKDLKAQQAEARVQTELKAAARASDRASKAAGSRASAYAPEVREAVKIAASIRGKSHGAGPKQHQHVREVVLAELGGDEPAAPGILASVVGVKNAGEFARLATTAPRGDLAVLRPIAAKMGDDPWCKGRHLAAALAAWAKQISDAQKRGG
jgi:hypothetical protein